MNNLSTISSSHLPEKNHNNPPSDVEWLEENLTLRHVHAIRAAEGHIEIAANIPEIFTQENEAKYTADFIKLMENCSKELERRREEEKNPFLRQGQCVDEFFKKLKNGLDESIKKAKIPLYAWIIKKATEEKQAREADARILIEQQQAAVKAAVSTTGEISSENAVQNVVEIAQQVKIAESLAAAPFKTLASTSGRVADARLATKWVGTIKNVEELELVKLRPYIAIAELQKALDRYVRNGGRDCLGAEITEVTGVSVK